MLRYKLSVKVKRSLAGCEPGTATFTRGEGGEKNVGIVGDIGVVESTVGD